MPSIRHSSLFALPSFVLVRPTSSFRPSSLFVLRRCSSFVLPSSSSSFNAVVVVTDSAFVRSVFALQRTFPRDDERTNERVKSAVQDPSAYGTFTAFVCGNVAWTYVSISRTSPRRWRRQGRATAWIGLRAWLVVFDAPLLPTTVVHRRPNRILQVSFGVCMYVCMYVCTHFAFFLSQRFLQPLGTFLGSREVLRSGNRVAGMFHRLKDSSTGSKIKAATTTTTTTTTMTMTTTPQRPQQQGSIYRIDR